MSRLLLPLALISLAAAPAHAALTVRYSATGSGSAFDQGYENVGGVLSGLYPGLVATGTAPGNVLIPLERAVVQTRSGTTDRRGLHLTSASTGVPVADGGSGVVNALTNYGAYAAATTDWPNGTAVAFSLSRTGNVLTWKVGNNTLTSNARASIGTINAFSIRIRSNPALTSAQANSLSLTGLSFTDVLTPTPQLLGDITAANGTTAIQLLDGISGDFTLTGNYLWSWSGTRPGGSALASQIKLLQVPVLAPPPGVPEPASWAMLVAGFGLAGAARRRRHRTLA